MCNVETRDPAPHTLQRDNYSPSLQSQHWPWYRKRSGEACCGVQGGMWLVCWKGMERHVIGERQEVFGKWKLSFFITGQCVEGSTRLLRGSNVWVSRPVNVFNIFTVWLNASILYLFTSCLCHCQHKTLCEKLDWKF